MRILRRSALGLALAAVCVSLCLGAATPPIITDPMKVFPPEAPWAKPDKAPPIRALVVAPWGATRDAYALAQHMNLRFDLITTYNEKVANFDPVTADRVDQPELAHTDRLFLPAATKRYDVFIFGAYSFGLLPAEAKYHIIRQVADGAGLVLVNQDLRTLGDLGKPMMSKSLGKGSDLVRCVPWEMFRTARFVRKNKYPGVRYGGDGEIVEAPYVRNPRIMGRIVGRYRIGRGRLAVLNYGRANCRFRGTCLTPSISYPLDKLFQHRQFLSAAAKQVRWAARGEPDLRVYRLTPSGRVARDKIEGGEIVLLGKESARGPVEIHVAVRDWGGRFEHRATHKAQFVRSGQKIAFPLPAVSDGEHFLEVRVLRNGSVADWGSAGLRVTSPVRVAGVSLRTDPDGALRKGDTLRGSVKLVGVTKPMRLEVLARDSYGRVEAVRTWPVRPGQTTQDLALQLPDPKGILFRAEARLLDGDAVVSRGAADFTVPRRITERRFLAISWAGATNAPNMIEKYRLIRRYGYDAVLTNFANDERARAIAHTDMLALPYMIRLMSCDAKTCFTTPTWRDNMSRGLEAQARMVSKYGALGYSLGDEVRLQRYVCDSPTCVAHFQRWLKKTYGDVAALNAQWGSRFRSFDRTTPKYLTKAAQEGRDAPTLDYLQSRRDLWVETCKHCHDAIQRGDPGSRMGYEGSGGYERWPELLRFFSITGPYTSYDLDTVLDESRPGTIIGNWIGNYQGIDRFGSRELGARYYSWGRVLLGFNSQWWWTTVMAMKGDLTPVERFRHNLETLGVIRRGLGKLIINWELQRDPVVIPYTPASDLATRFHSELTTMKVSKGTLRAMLREQSLRWRRVPMKRIAKGALGPLGTKVVLLPYQQAMSRDEAAGLRRFVEAGGVLVADLRPAVLNEHARPLKEGYLDAVFGILRKEMKPPHTAKGKPTMRTSDGAFKELAGLGGELRADKSVELRPGARAHGSVGGAPVCIENRVGRGRAILLNFALDEYRTLRTENAHRPLKSMFARLLSGSGVKSGIRVLRNGKSLDALNTPRWRSGGALMVGVDRGAVAPARDKPARVRVHLPKRGHVYDVLAGAYLGERASVDTTLEVAKPKFFAQLPYRIGAVSVKAPPRAKPGDRVPVRLGLAAGAGPTHIVTLDVYRPDGSWAHYHRQRVEMKGRTATVHVPLAWNAPPGAWKLEAREVIGGQTAEARLEVEKGGRP